MPNVARIVVSGSRPSSGRSVVTWSAAPSSATTSVAILLVEQNVPLTLEASRRVYIMEKGAVRHHAAASELKASDAVIHQYLGV